LERPALAGRLSLLGRSAGGTRFFTTTHARCAALCGILNRMKFRCPICKKPTDSEANPEFPFCSERCKLFDLGNWSSEKYVISEPANDDTLYEDITRESPDEHKN
jgi:endogenous inhibitor of DNA gyrase (YacG/DUF329 family)